MKIILKAMKLEQVNVDEIDHINSYIVAFFVITGIIRSLMVYEVKIGKELSTPMVLENLINPYKIDNIYIYALLEGLLFIIIILLMIKVMQFVLAIGKINRPYNNYLWLFSIAFLPFLTILAIIVIAVGIGFSEEIWLNVLSNIVLLVNIIHFQLMIKKLSAELSFLVLIVLFVGSYFIAIIICGIIIVGISRNI